MTEERLAAYLDDAMGDRVPLRVTAMVGGGSCEVFAVDRGRDRWVLRRAPKHASSSSAHDVLREFRILDAIKDTSVPIARPVVACGDPEVFGAPFYVMDRIEGKPILRAVPEAWAAAPESQGRALEQLIDALVAIHAVDWHACGLGDLAHGRRLPGAPAHPVAHPARLLRWPEPSRRPQRGRLARGRTGPPASRAPCATVTTSSTTCCLRRSRPLGCWPSWTGRWPASATRSSTWRGRSSSTRAQRAPCAWAWPRSRGSTWLTSPTGARCASVTRPARAATSRRSPGTTCSPGWKLALVLEGSFAKFQRGLSDKPVHEHFGDQVDLLLASAGSIIDRGGAP